MQIKGRLFWFYNGISCTLPSTKSWLFPSKFNPNHSGTLNSLEDNNMQNHQTNRLLGSPPSMLKPLVPNLLRPHFWVHHQYLLTHQILSHTAPVPQLSQHKILHQNCLLQGLLDCHFLSHFHLQVKECCNLPPLHMDLRCGRCTVNRWVKQFERLRNHPHCFWACFLA